MADGESKVSMKRYALRRLLEIVPLLFGIVVVVFTLVHLSPGDPVTMIVGEFGASAEYIESMRTEFGLDKPLYMQLLIYIAKLLSGDLGYSLWYNQRVIDLIKERLPNTLLLMGTMLVISNAIGVTIGVIASKRPYSLKDNIASIFCLLFYSLPSFWLGILLILFFSLQLGLFPTSGMLTLTQQYSGFGGVFDLLRHLFLPSVALGLRHMALTTRLTRASMLEVMRQDYITTAWSKGLDDNRVFYRHALKNAVLPVITMLGIDVGHMVAGTTMIETIFCWPGIGRLMYEALNTRDYPLMMGIFVVTSISVIAANLLTDLVYAHLDPRIRYE